MFVNHAEFPPVKQGKEEEFLAWFAWSNTVYERFDGFISRRLLKANDGSGAFIGVVEHESKETFMAMHLSDERRKAWERLAPLLEGKAKPHFYDEVMRTVKTSGPTGRVEPQAESGKWKFEIPEAMKTGHDELHADLVRLTGTGGRTGEAAKAVAKVLHPHFVKENEYALPPLSLLVPLSQGRFDLGMTEVLKLTGQLAADMPHMLSEHRDVVAALQKLTEAATAENNAGGVQFARMLTAHAQVEEQVVYPTALLIGLYVKSRISG